MSHKLIDSKSNLKVMKGKDKGDTRKYIFKHKFSLKISYHKIPAKLDLTLDYMFI